MLIKRAIKVTTLFVTVIFVVTIIQFGHLFFQVKDAMQIDETSYIDIESQRPPVDPDSGHSINVLVIGVDTRDGEQNAQIGGIQADVQGLHNSDTTILVHISSDRTRVTAISIPRDTIIDSPECHLKDAKNLHAEKQVMFNSVFARAWATSKDDYSAAQCVQKTVETISGVFINYAMVVDFAGFENMVDAIDGVSICVPSDIDAPDAAELKLAAGQHHLNGFQAVNYARARKGSGLGDQSDLSRIGRQQKLIGSIFKTVVAKDFTDITMMRKFLTETVKAFKTTMPFQTTLGVAWSLKNIDLENVSFLMVPVEKWSQNANRVVFTPEANEIWENIRKDEPIVQEQSEEDEKPTFEVQNATGADLCE